MASQYIVISTAQTDLGLTSGTFFLKINKLPKFTEITDASVSMGEKCVYMAR